MWVTKIFGSTKNVGPKILVTRSLCTSMTGLEQRKITLNFLKDDRDFETATAMKSVVPRTVADWNELPHRLRGLEKSTEF